MYSFLNHAKHNRDVCKYLNKSGSVFGDWVITTAYYSAIYFIIHELFPNQYEINGRPRRYSNFEEYYRDYKLLNKGVVLNQHKARLQLVEDYLPEIYPQL